MLDKFLVVGCGGSGGRTVRYLRAELLRRLQAVGYTEGLPDGWGFVHVDVPTVSDVEDAGPDDALHYIGLASQGITYGQADRLVWNRSEAHQAHIAGWRPPATLRLDPTTGAGQMRAVGRIVTAAAIAKLADGLNQALDQVVGAGPAPIGLTEASVALGQGDGGARRTWIFVVSSLAGGSGAGMYLDVCDALRMLSAGRSIPLVGVLFAPDIFADVQGAGAANLAPNGLAALSELLSAYWDGEAPTANEFALLQSKDLVVPQGRTQRGPTYPLIISRTNGEVTLPTQRDVYRLTGAALAALMLDSKAQASMYSYTASNWVVAGSREDRSGLTGGSSQTQPLSSFGYSSVSVGRDRFAVYGAQRLSGELAMHLLNGHRGGGISSGEDAGEVAAAYLDAFLDRCKLEEKQQTDHDILDALRGWADADWKPKLVAEVDTLKSALTDGRARLERDTLANALRTAVGTRREKFVAEETARVEGNAQQWVLDVQASILTATTTSLAGIGGRGTIAVLELVQRYLRDEVAPSMRSEARNLDEAATTMSWGQKVAGILRAAPNTLLPGAPELTSATQAGVRSFRLAVEAKINTLAAALVVDLADNFIEPLRRGLTSALDELQLVVEGTAANPSPIKGWASGVVPDDLLPAQYEVMLEDPTKWPAIFDRILQQQMKIEFAEEARRAALKEALTYGQVLAPSRRWSPAAATLTTEAGPTRAQFAMGLSVPALVASCTGWLQSPNAVMHSYTEQQLGEWLDGEEGAGNSAGERQQRFTTGLQSALTKGRPLIDLDNDAIARVHSDPAIADDFALVMTPLPLNSNHPVAAGLLQALIRAKVLSGTTKPNDPAFQNLFDTNTKNAVIGILTFLGGPVSPLVVNSIAEPLAAAADIRRGDPNFYRHTRARPLNQAVPAPPGFLRGLVRGWYVGRLLGYIDIGTVAKPRVWTSSGWLTFTEFLGAAPKGAGDVFGALCESMPLAVVKSVRANADALRFHRAVAELGMAHNAAGPDQNDGGLPQTVVDWVATGTYPAGTEHAIVTDAQWTEPAGRIKALLHELHIDLDAYVKIKNGAPPEQQDIYIRRRWDLAADIVDYLTELSDLINAVPVVPPRG